jgi:hypothetical protein
MYSANCRDYLEVPVDAVDDVTMTECEPPYISRSDDSNDSYVGVFVKKYKQSGDNLFKRHVKIVSYYTLHNSKTSISSDDLRIRYSEKDGSFSLLNTRIMKLMCITLSTTLRIVSSFSRDTIRIIFWRLTSNQKKKFNFYTKKMERC